jgi:hypothetical protein
MSISGGRRATQAGSPVTPIRLFLLRAERRQGGAMLPRILSYEQPHSYLHATSALLPTRLIIKRSLGRH